MDVAVPPIKHDHDVVCVTCRDVGEAVRVVWSDSTSASCEKADGTLLEVATDFVAPLHPGEMLLVHAGVAISKLEADSPAS